MSKTSKLEDFVPFEIAQKLKEKGYPLLRVIKQRGEPIIYDLPQNHPNWQNCNAYYIPTISQVLKWLRDTHNIHINIYFFRFNGNTELCWVFSIENIKDDFEYDWLYSSKHNSYEEAALAGIESVLDNLI